VPTVAEAIWRGLALWGVRARTRRVRDGITIRRPIDPWELLSSVMSMLIIGETARNEGANAPKDDP